ncbi:MAG: GNAT family N-acetyltransferase, partial [Cellulosilyticaceae bacterium]
KRGTFYIAFLNEQPCGELFWCNAGEGLPEEAQIIAIHSLENSWGTGVGKAMIDRALADIHKSGMRKVGLWVFKDNMRARRFYEKCGFRHQGEEKTSDFGDVIEVKYVKQL